MLASAVVDVASEAVAAVVLVAVVVVVLVVVAVFASSFVVVHWVPSYEFGLAD